MGVAPPMTGSLFARTLKTNPEIRKDFENWLKEHRAFASHDLENAGADIAIFQAQGKIRMVESLKFALQELMNSPVEEQIA